MNSPITSTPTLGVGLAGFVLALLLWVWAWRASLCLSPPTLGVGLAGFVLSSYLGCGSPPTLGVGLAGFVLSPPAPSGLKSSNPRSSPKPLGLLPPPLPPPPPPPPSGVKSSNPRSSPKPLGLFPPPPPPPPPPSGVKSSKPRSSPKPLGLLPLPPPYGLRSSLWFNPESLFPRTTPEPRIMARVLHFIIEMINIVLRGPPALLETRASLYDHNCSRHLSPQSLWRQISTNYASCPD